MKIGVLLEVDMELIETKDEWSSIFSVEDLYKPDDIRDALLQGNIFKASQLSKVYNIASVAI